VGFNACAVYFDFAQQPFGFVACKVAQISFGYLAAATVACAKD
jgi:hypothetical protein